MSGRERDIFFTLVYGESTLRIKTFHGEFRSLMTLIAETVYADEFGDCKGVGRCGTCAVEIEGGNAELGIMSGNEPVTLGRLALTGASVRLACKIMIDTQLNNTTVRVLENY